MRYVQVAILVLLGTCAVLLFQIYRTQHPASAQEEAFASTRTLEKPAVQLVAPPSPPPPPPQEAKTEPTKPRPIRKPRPAPAVARKPAAPPSIPESVETPEPVDSEPAPTPTAADLAPKEIKIDGLPAETASSRSDPAPPPQPRRVVLPSNTEIVVRLDQYLSTKRNLGGDTFYASLEKPITVNDLLVAERGARIEGRVVSSERAGRLKGRSKLTIDLVRLNAADGQTVDIVTNRVHRQGDESKAEDMKKVGIGAGIGALVGAIAGGGKGAAIGAGIGAGAGGGAVAATRGKEVELPAETRLTFRLLEPVEIVEKL